MKRMARRKRTGDDAARRAVRARIAAGIFAMFYAGLLVYNLSVGSKGWWDNCATIVMLGLFAAVARAARIDALDIVLLNVPLILHNAGTVGDAWIYGLALGPLPYDKTIHLLSGVVIAYVLAGLFSRSAGMKRLPLALTAIGATLVLGVLGEWSEFIGYLLQSDSSGFFSPAAGTLVHDPSFYYADTMWDLAVNLLGACVGATAAIAVRRRKTRKDPLVPKRLT